MIQTILGWVTGPLTRLGELYMQGRNEAQAKALENQAQRDFLQNEMQKHLLENEGKAAQMVANMLRADRGDGRTSWIRPLTAAIALIFWLALTLSQIVWVGWGASQALLPVVWHVPPGQLGNLFLAFPMGVLATFYIARPVEKYLLGKS